MLLRPDHSNDPERAREAAIIVAAAHLRSNMKVSVETLRRPFDSVAPGRVLITYIWYDAEVGEEVPVECVTLHQSEWNNLLQEALSEVP